MVLVYMLTLGILMDPWHTIYSSTMDPMGMEKPIYKWKTIYKHIDR